MAPAVGVEDATSDRDRNRSLSSDATAAAKQISQPAHARREGDRRAYPQDKERQESEANADAAQARQGGAVGGEIARLSKLPCTCNAENEPVRPKISTRFSASPSLPSSPSHPLAHQHSPPGTWPIQNAAQLSERDSIFATHYLPSDAALTPTIHSAVGKNDEGRRRSAGDESRKHDHDSNMEVSSYAPALHHSHLHHQHQHQEHHRSGYHYSHLPKDAPPSAASLYQTQQLNLRQATRKTRPSRTSFPLNYHRRSLYDLNDLSSLQIASLLQHSEASQRILPETPLSSLELPATPSSSVATEHADNLDQSAERQSYRSWRKGQAKMSGMSIKESQRRSNQTQTDVDRVIDAQLPQPGPMANARSRKSSHYMGLFKENEAEERRDNEKKKYGGDMRSDGTKDGKAYMKDAVVSEPTIVEDIESEENRNQVTVSQARMAKQLPLGLLNEIRSHEGLTREAKKETSHASSVPPHLLGQISQGYNEQEGKAEEEDSEKEHISSATYFPHPGTLADSPTDDQLAERKPQSKTGSVKSSAQASSNDVQVSLQSEDARDFLLGASQPPEIHLPEPAVPELPPTPSDSGDETDHGYESTLSVDELEDLDSTPTGTSMLKSHRRSSQRRQPHQTPAPLGAVELKPYKHQVGGHTPVYRFSRRAICKQLNSKENKFYETVEQHHPSLLGFMPRYIGVLNVTYRKDQKKRKQTVSEGSKAQQEKQSDNAKLDTGDGKKEQVRMISHSMQTPSAVPQVIFENNRHLIPDDLFPALPRSTTPELQRSKLSRPQRGNQSDDEASNGASRRPSLRTATSSSDWGFTRQNKGLRDYVLREVFGPPVIHKHDRRERAYHSRHLRRLPKHMQDELGHGQRQNSVDVSSLQRFQTTDPDAIKGPSPHVLPQTFSDLGEGIGSDFDQLLRERSRGLSKSAETSDVDVPIPSSSNRSHHRRRHSGGGLTRKPVDIEGSRGDLEFHENEDEVYAADAEEDVFSMDDVKTKQIAAADQQGHQPNFEDDNHLSRQLDPAIDFGEPEPRNPETSLVQHDERVERFLLLEDLTSGMQKPCVLDLKMGTRQYGIEATEKKQASQRMKCKTTTSRKLGVRVCGMQVFNVREQRYNFEDKYYGRDLAAGNEFQEALKRFFFDGIGHAQAMKHIPSVLEKINQLDRIIRELPGYRLYASSLLMIYDRGEADENGKVQPGWDEQGRPAQYPDIKLKIVDFANCVTAEDRERILRKPCPPQNPDAIDRGYLRGLRTLKAYFQKIYQDLVSQRYVERGEGEGMAIDQRGISGGTAQKGWTDSVIDDPGEVSV